MVQVFLSRLFFDETWRLLPLEHLLKGAAALREAVQPPRRGLRTNLPTAGAKTRMTSETIILSHAHHAILLTPGNLVTLLGFENLRVTKNSTMFGENELKSVANAFPTSRPTSPK